MIRQILVVSVVVATLVGCSNKPRMYEAEQDKTIVLPDGVALNIDDQHIIPKGDSWPVELKRAAADIRPPISTDRNNREIVLKRDGNENPLLSIKDNFDSVWEDVVAAGSRAYGVTDINRTQGIIFLNYYDTDDGSQKKHWFFGRKIKGQFRLSLFSTTEDVQVSVQTDSDELASKETAEKILTVIESELRR
ncbi:outer membrane protein assembly factor BamC [Gynuella sunshinyii]|uniref:outer membrane protein assembly factor BamC n=1 Tax=Gynuella sunshinyii TaxID=1445505 RepID=UPI001185131B|nr:outer membrane protein assembly factor BamC [Gynuella sunshinyii]